MAAACRLDRGRCQAAGGSVQVRAAHPRPGGPVRAYQEGEGVAIGNKVDDANRRLAGILAADVVGYSAMVGTDEPATLARVRTLRTDLVEPLAAEHGGRLFKTTGDGFLAAFASAVQALRCAIAIQERLRSEPDGLRLRIGVHQGEVVAEGDDLLGDGVIIAARLEPLAEPGGICISARVREDAAGKMALEVDRSRHAGTEEHCSQGPGVPGSARHARTSGLAVARQAVDRGAAVPAT